MKNIFKILACGLLVAGVSSCAKEEIGGTAVQDMAGEWYVTIDYVDEDGNVLMPLGSGSTLYTYNTNANLATEMYIEDSYFKGFRVMVDVDYANKTFSGKDVEDDYYDGTVYDVLNGSVVKDGAVSDAGYTADAISFVLVESGYDEEYEEYYTDYYHYYGYRRTGLLGGYD